MRRINCEVCAERQEGRFCDLPLETLAVLRNVGVTTLYRQRQLLFGEGNPVGGLHIVCQGSVKLYQSDRFGRARLLEVAGPGSVLGELALGGKDGLSASAEALEDCQVCFVPGDQLVEVLHEHPEVGVRLVEALSQELATARKKIRDLVFKDAASRLAMVLVELADEAGIASGEATLVLPFSRAELAQRVGVSTETVIRLLAKLSKRGILELDRRSVRIPDVERLVRLARSDELDA